MLPHRGRRLLRGTTGTEHPGVHRGRHLRERCLRVRLRQRLSGLLPRGQGGHGGAEIGGRVLQLCPRPAEPVGHLGGMTTTFPPTALQPGDEHERRRQQRRDERRDAEQALRDELIENAGTEMPASEISEAFELLSKQAMRKHIIDSGIRIDGRGLDDIRALSAEVSLLPRVHGSALFNRGETQVLNIVTLGSADDEQRIEWLSEDGTRRYMHHYNFPVSYTHLTLPTIYPG